MISNTLAIVKKFFFRIWASDLIPKRGKPNKNFQQLKRLRRRYTSVGIFELPDCYYRHPKMIPAILKYFPDLEYLALDLGLVDNSLTPVTLPELKKLKTFGDYNSFQFIRAPALTSLDASCCSTSSNFNLGNFENFLKAAPKLENLMVESLELFGNMDSDFPFKLKQLTCKLRTTILNESMNISF